MRFGLGIALTLIVSTANAAPMTCLNERQVRGFDYKNDRETVAITNDSQRFLIRFRARCGYDKFYPQLVFDMTPSGECLQAGNVLLSHDGGSCIIQEITPASP